MSYGLFDYIRIVASVVIELTKAGVVVYGLHWLGHPELKWTKQ